MTRLLARLTLAMALVSFPVAPAHAAPSAEASKQAEDALRRKQRLGSRAARRQAKSAKTIADNPDVQDALANGEISEEHADALADAESEHDGAVGELLPKAKEQGADRFRASARSWSRCR